MKKLVSVLLVLVITHGVSAQVPEIPAQTYTLDTTNVPLTNIRHTGIPLNLGDDLTRTVELPFEFKFFGNTYNSATISQNGFLSFNDNGSGCCNGLSLPNLSYKNSIFALWTNLNDSLHVSNPFTESFSDKFIVGWYNIREYGSTTHSFDTEITLFSNYNFSINYSNFTGSPTLSHNVTSGYQGSTTDQSYLIYHGNSPKSVLLNHTYTFKSFIPTSQSETGNCDICIISPKTTTTAQNNRSTNIQSEINSNLLNDEQIEPITDTTESMLKDDTLVTSTELKNLLENTLTTSSLYTVTTTKQHDNGIVQNDSISTDSNDVTAIADNDVTTQESLSDLSQHTIANEQNLEILNLLETNKQSSQLITNEDNKQFEDMLIASNYDPNNPIFMTSPSVINLELLGVIKKQEEKSDAEKTSEQQVIANKEEQDNINSNYMELDQSGILGAISNDTNILVYNKAMIPDTNVWYKSEEIYKNVTYKDNSRSLYFLEKGSTDTYNKMIQDQYK